MKLATIRHDGRLRAVRVDGDEAVDLGVGSVGALLERDDWRAMAEAGSGPALDARALDYAPVVPAPSKIICVGLNYRTHIMEMGMAEPEHPTLFAKFPSALIGAHDDIVLPPESDMVDWEAELALVIGRRVRRARGAEAQAAIAGFAVLNDVSMRDWQFRTEQWFQGKTFDRSTPFGPWLVTPDEAPFPQGRISCKVDGEALQDAELADLLFDPVALIAYVSTVVTLQPGDVIATGTPGGVGLAREPARYLRSGQAVTTEIDGLGACRNTCRPEPEVDGGQPARESFHGARQAADNFDDVVLGL